MSYTLDTFKVGRCTVRIESDEDPINPRKDYDNVGTMVCWHRRYDLGDEQPNGENGGDYLLRLAREADAKFDKWMDGVDGIINGLDDPAYSRVMKNVGEKRERVLREHYVILPLYLYDHSGITMSTGPFSCPWDSGQVGFIYCTLEKAQEEWGTEDSKVKGWDGEASFTPKDDGTPSTLREAATAYLEGEVNEYDQYLTGDVWGYVVEADNGEEEDSCWGFFGSDYCREEATSVAKAMTERIIAEEAEEARLAAVEAEERAYWEAREVVTV